MADSAEISILAGSQQWSFGLQDSQVCLSHFDKM